MTIKFSYCSQWPAIHIPDPPVYLNYYHAFWQPEKKDCRLNGCQDGCITGTILQEKSAPTSLSGPDIQQCNLRSCKGVRERLPVPWAELPVASRGRAASYMILQKFDHYCCSLGPCVFVLFVCLGAWQFILTPASSAWTRGSEMVSVISLVQCQNPLYVCKATEDNLIAKCFWWQKWPAHCNTLEKQEKGSKITFSFLASWQSQALAS